MTQNHFETVAEDLRDPEFAEAYLQETWEEGIPVFLVALRDVVTATIGMTRLAERVGMSRESLYKALSDTGNPQLKTIQKVVQELGFDFQLSLAARTK